MSARRKKGKNKKRSPKANRRTLHTPPSPSRPHWALAGALVASAALGGLPAPLFAQNPARPQNTRVAVRAFEIAPGTLEEVLAEFGRATGLTVIDPLGLAAGVNSPGVIGTFSDEDGLRQLLAGTGVTYRFTNARSLRLERLHLGLADTTSAVGLPTITVESERVAPASPKYTEPLRDTPQSISIVPRSVIEAQGATSLRDVVRNVPGLTVNAGEGGATPGDNFNLRGFSARSDIFVDGVRTAGGYSRETFNVEQVEVTKGPASAYIGRGSTGGAINLVTKTPKLARAYGGSLGVGSAEFQRATVDVNQPVDVAGLPGAAVRLNAEWQDAGVAGLPEVEKNAWGIAPSAAIGLGTSTRLVLDYSHTEQDNTPAYGIQVRQGDDPPAVDTHQFFGLRNLDFERVDADRATARVEHDVNANLTLRNQFTWAREDVRRIVTYANEDGTRRSPSHYTTDENFTNLTSLSTGFRTGEAAHAVTAGVELSRERSYFARYNFSEAPPAIADLANPNPDDRYEGVVTVAPPRRDATANSIGVYAFETVTLGEQWELSAGLRWDYFDPTYRDTLGTVISPPNAASDALSWRAGAVYKPVPFGSVYLAYGTSFNPSGESLSYDRNGTTGLEPERNRSVELGTKWDLLGERLLLTAAVFRTEKTNARMTDPNDPLGDAIILAGKQRVDGTELGVTGRILPSWSVFAGYTWLDSEILTGDPEDVGQPLPNTPTHALSIWTTYRMPWELEVGAGARHISRRVMSPTSSVPPYWAFDAEAAYPVTERLSLRLNLYNLTDATYFDHGRFWVPAASRSVRLSTVINY